MITIMLAKKFGGNNMSYWVIYNKPLSSYLIDFDPEKSKYKYGILAKAIRFTEADKVHADAANFLAKFLEWKKIEPFGI